MDTKAAFDACFAHLLSAEYEYLSDKPDLDALRYHRTCYQAMKETFIHLGILLDFDQYACQKRGRMILARHQ